MVKINPRTHTHTHPLAHECTHTHTSTHPAITVEKWGSDSDSIHSNVMSVRKQPQTHTHSIIRREHETNNKRLNLIEM